MGHDKKQGYLNVAKYFIFGMPKTAFISILIVICCIVFQSYFSKLALFLICVGCILICGYDILIGAFKAAVKKRFLHPDIYLTVAIVGTFIIGMYYEAIIATAVFAMCRSVVSTLDDWMRHKYQTDSERYLQLEMMTSIMQKRLTNAITAFSVIALAAIVAMSVLIPLFWRVPFTSWLRRAFILLAAACPGALSMTMVVEYFKCLNTACAEGIIFCSKDALETAGHVTSVAMSDVTVDVMSGYNIESVEPVGVTRETLMMLGAYVCSFCEDEKYAAVVKESGVEVDISKVEMYKTIPGIGAAISLGGVKVFAGNSDLMVRFGVEIGSAEYNDLHIHIAVEKKYAGKFVLKKAGDNAYAKTVKKLHEIEIDRVILLTSQSEHEAVVTAEKIGVSEVWADMPLDAQLEKLYNLEKMQLENEKIAFIADSFAELGLVKAADIGIAVGIIADDSAQIQIHDSDHSKAADALKLARAFLSNTRYNLFLACALKAVTVFLAIIGFAGIWSVAVIDAVAAAIVLSDKKKKQYR